MISPQLLNAYWSRRRQGDRAYRLAQQAGVHPSVFSALLNESVPVRRGDQRVVRIGEVLGVPADQCFADEHKAVTA